MGEHLSPVELAEAGYNRWMSDQMVWLQQSLPGIASIIVLLVLLVVMVSLLLMIMAGYAKNKGKDRARAEQNRFAKLDGVIRPPPPTSDEPLSEEEVTRAKKYADLEGEEGFPPHTGVIDARMKDRARAEQSRFAKLDGVIRPPPPTSDEPLSEEEVTRAKKYADLEGEEGFPPHTGVIDARMKRGNHKGKPS